MKRLAVQMGLFVFVVALGLSLSGWSGSKMRAFAYQDDVPQILIRDNNKSLSLDCAGAAVTVKGNHNTITLTGTCSSLAVQGNKNTITLEASTVVTDNGNNNTITMLQSAPAITATSAPTLTPLPPTGTPLPTDTPPSPTDTPQAPTPTPTQQEPTATPGEPTDTPEGPTDTPQSPTDTPQAPTSTPQPTTEPPVIDREPPTVRWIGPVLAGERYDIRDGEQINVEVEASDNVSVSTVKFLWWDAVNERYVTLATLVQPPYRVQVSAGDLNPEWNQVFAIASDQVQNISDYASIWLYKLALPGSQSGYQVFLPLTGR